MLLFMYFLEERREKFMLNGKKTSFYQYAKKQVGAYVFHIVSAAFTNEYLCIISCLFISACVFAVMRSSVGIFLKCFLLKKSVALNQ